MLVQYIFSIVLVLLIVGLFYKKIYYLCDYAILIMSLRNNHRVKYIDFSIVEDFINNGEVKRVPGFGLYLVQGQSVLMIDKNGSNVYLAQKNRCGYPCIFKRFYDYCMLRDKVSEYMEEGKNVY